MLRAFTFLAACIPAVAVFAAQQHPRLFATAELLAAIKAQIAVPGSFHQQAYMAMKARVDAPDWKSRYEETRKYQHGSNTALFIPGFMAREAALLALLADNPQEQTRYATQAHDALKGIDYLGSSVLNRATQTMSLALAYDWLYNIWTEQQPAPPSRAAFDGGQRAARPANA